MPKCKSQTCHLFNYQILALGFLLLCVSAKGQTDSVSTQPDTAKHVRIKEVHSPGKAVLYSAILPGLGQAYNRKYWKIPIIYAGVGVITYFIIFNQQQYSLYNNALIERTNNVIDPKFSVYSNTDLSSLVDYYHRDRDLSIICAAGLYVLNLIDAEVDAQLFSFNISDDLSMHLTPRFDMYTAFNNAYITPGLSLCLKLK
jgi:hypothetical protein